MIRTTPDPDAPNGLIRSLLPYRVEEWGYDTDTSRSLWRAVGAFRTLEDAERFGIPEDAPYGRIRHSETHQTLRFAEHPSLASFYSPNLHET